MSRRGSPPRVPARRRAPFGALWVASLLTTAVVPVGRALAADLDSAESTPTYPLVLLVQLDAVAASAAAGRLAPDDPPSGARVQLRRARVGDDVRKGAFRLRAVFEGEAARAGGPWSPVEGGRLPVGAAAPVRATEVTASWVPADVFHADVGSLRVPFSLSRRIDEASLRLPERPGFVDALAPDRVGGALGGELGELGYHAGFFSAATTLDEHVVDAGWLVAARLIAEPVGPVGVAPWDRRPDDPWYAWFRFAANLSVLYGRVIEPRTLAVEPDFTVQWKAFVASSEYIYDRAPSGDRQGAAVEPGVVLWGRRLNVVARLEWERLGAGDTLGGGFAVTGYAPDRRLRISAAFERRHSSGSVAGTPVDSGWALGRVTVALP
jgi:hypothetical protein